MRVFLTGATGVIGARVVPLLVAEGRTVIAVGRSADKCTLLEGMGAIPIPVDLFDRVTLRRAVAGHDAIVNLATHIPGNAQMFLPGAWRMTDRIRREASAALVDAALAVGATRFIQESFALVYPDRGDNWIDESTPIQPLQ